MKKYEFAGYSPYGDFRRLYRIRALKDILEKNVKKGDLGGYIMDENCLSHHGTCWVGGEAMVNEGARVYDDALVTGNAKITHRAQVYGNAIVSEYAWINHYAKIYDYAQIYGRASVSDNCSIHGHAVVKDTVDIYQNARIEGNAKIYDNARISEYAWINGDAVISENAKIRNRASITDCARIRGNAIIDTATISGNANIYGDAYIGNCQRISHDAEIYKNSQFGLIMNAGIFTNTKSFWATYVGMLEEPSSLSWYLTKDKKIKIILSDFNDDIDKFAQYVKETYNNDHLNKECELLIEFIKLRSIFQN